MNPLHRASLLFIPPVLAACALHPVPPVVPAAIVPSAGQYVETLAARGVQVYECRAISNNAGGPAWAFVAPEAELFDAAGRPAGKHYAGPHWESLDGSKIQGSVKARADAPATGAIPWLLLATKSDGGPGAFAKVTSVQRINTVGGVQPAAGCTGNTIGTREGVPYTADYVLFAAAS